jgi:hypothetical protein
MQQTNIHIKLELLTTLNICPRCSFVILSIFIMHHKYFFGSNSYPTVCNSKLFRNESSFSCLLVTHPHWYDPSLQGKVAISLSPTCNLRLYSFMKGWLFPQNLHLREGVQSLPSSSCLEIKFPPLPHPLKLSYYLPHLQLEGRCPSPRSFRQFPHVSIDFIFPIPQVVSMFRIMRDFTSLTLSLVSSQFSFPLNPHLTSSSSWRCARGLLTIRNEPFPHNLLT